MRRLEYLMGTLAEECSEVAQMCSKNNRFGLQEIFPEQPLTNAQRLHIELDDICALVDMLNREFQLGYVRNEERVKAKIDKVEKFYAYSKSLGLIDDDVMDASTEQLKKLISDDTYAISFQSMAQYRKALLESIEVKA